MSEEKLPFSIGWYLQNCVLYAHIEHTLVGDDGALFNKQMIEHIRAGKPPVFLIMDLRHLKMETTPHVASIRKVGTYRDESNLRWMISVISDDRVLNFAVSTANQASGISHANVTTLDEAIKFVHERMHNADWTQADERVFVA